MALRYPRIHPSTNPETPPIDTGDRRRSTVRWAHAPDPRRRRGVQRTGNHAQGTARHETGMRARWSSIACASSCSPSWIKGGLPVWNSRTPQRSWRSAHRNLHCQSFEPFAGLQKLRPLQQRLTALRVVIVLVVDPLYAAQFVVGIEVPPAERATLLAARPPAASSHGPPRPGRRGLLRPPAPFRKENVGPAPLARRCPCQ
jgi:hypothetical protein